MKPLGTAEDLQRRRIRAVELVGQGESLDDVARFLGCGRSSVYTWVKQAEGSIERLVAKPHAGPKPRLDDAQLEQLEDEWEKGAKAHGWKTGLGTAARVAVLIDRSSKTTFHVEHARKARRSGEALVFPDESGFMPGPSVWRTYAPIGRTPILRRWDRRETGSRRSAA